MDADGYPIKPSQEPASGDYVYNPATPSGGPESSPPFTSPPFPPGGMGPPAGVPYGAMPGQQAPPGMVYGMPGQQYAPMPGYGTPMPGYGGPMPPMPSPMAPFPAPSPHMDGPAPSPLTSSPDGRLVLTITPTQVGCFLGFHVNENGVPQYSFLPDPASGCCDKHYLFQSIREGGRVLGKFRRVNESCRPTYVGNIEILSAAGPVMTPIKFTTIIDFTAKLKVNGYNRHNQSVLASEFSNMMRSEEEFTIYSTKVATSKRAMMTLHPKVTLTIDTVALARVFSVPGIDESRALSSVHGIVLCCIIRWMMMARR